MIGRDARFPERRVRFVQGNFTLERLSLCLLIILHSEQQCSVRRQRRVGEPAHFGICRRESI